MTSERSDSTRHSLATRATALILSWTVASPTVWAGAPPLPRPGRSSASPSSSFAVPRPAAPRAGVAPIGGLSVPAAALQAGPVAAMAAAPPAEVLLATIPAAHAIEDPPGGGSPDEFNILPCKKYVRTCGPKTVYTEHVTVPPWVGSPFRMHVQNGEPNGTHRVSSATVEVNGVEVIHPQDLNQNVASLDRSVNLTPQTTLKITLASRPSSYLRICLFGANQDRTPPEVTVLEPPPDSLGNNTRPRLRVRYRDLVGPGESSASGVRRSTLKILLDGHDRTHLFCIGGEEANAVLPASLALADGVHTLSASIEDKAGNVGQGSGTFRVDTVPPTVTVVEPTEGAYLATDTPTIVVAYADDVALDLDSLRVLINGEDRTSLFVKEADRAVAVLDASSRLPPGPSSIAASIKDRAGNPGSGGRAFQVDVVPPQLVIGQPAAEARLGSPMVEVIVQYRDDQALDLDSFEAKVDGQPVELSKGPEGAMGVVGPLADGRHSLQVAIADRATNRTEETVGFWVDTQSPTIRIVQPPPGFIIKNPRPVILVAYADEQGVDTSTFRMWLDAVDRTSWCEVGSESAVCRPDEDLPEGQRTVRAEIRDLAANPPGSAESTFTVDSQAPTGQVAAPGPLTNDSTPEVHLVYQDATSGIDAETLRVFLDEVEVTSLFSRNAAEAKAVLVEPLTDGVHTLRFLISDRAANEAQVPETPWSFTVDTQPPTGGFTAPGAFVNDTTPLLRLTYQDGTGSGVVPQTLRVYLQKGTDPEIDVTGYFEAGETQADGEVPEEAALADGSYRLRALIEDRAGNRSEEILWHFLVDTVPPTYEVKAPAHESFSATATPAFEVCYADDASGVDLTTLAFGIDENDRTARLTKGPLCATGTLLTEEKLAEGQHETFVTIADQAGNVSVPVPHKFWVDTIPPQVRLETPPPGSFVGTAPTPIRFVYSDNNPMGVDTASIVIYVDGVDRTAEFTVAADKAEATLPLADGIHVVRIDVPDWADNTTTVTEPFTVDTQPPDLTPQPPGDDSYIPEIDPSGTVRIAGTVTDLDPQLTVTCTVGTTTVDGTITNGQYSCEVPLTEGSNSVRVVVKDRTGHETFDDRDLNLDTIRPDVTIRVPVNPTVTAATAIDVAGDVVDASPVTVKVNGIDAVVEKPSFIAPAVPLGDGPTVTIEAVAEDAAGHTDTDSVTVVIDRQSPVVVFTRPAPGECVAGPVVRVEGTVEDQTAVTVFVNGQPAQVVDNRTFSVDVPVSGPELHLAALATDAAGNTGEAQQDVRVDSVAPAIVVELPQPEFVTNQDTIRVKGSVADDCGPVTLESGGLEIPVAPDGSFDRLIPVPGEGRVLVSLTARDRPGNVGTASVSGLVDRVKPLVQITVPATDGTVVDQFPLVVVGTVVDDNDTTVVVNGAAAQRTGQTWQIVVPELPDGLQPLTATANDIAGNVSDPAVRSVEVSFKPTVSITSPDDGALTRHAAVPVSGGVSRAVGVTVNGVAASLTGSTFTALDVPLQPGENVVKATARNAAGRTAEAQVTVVRDDEPPSVDLTAPPRLVRGQSGQAEAVVTDNVGVATVTLAVNDVPAATFTQPPYVIPLEAPPDAPNGHLLVVTATAGDRAGNVSAPVSADVRVSAGGVVVGQVLVDESSLPLAGATVRMGPQEALTDEQGRYSFPATTEAARLVVTKDGMTRVERESPVAPGVGNVPIDARLTSLAAPQTIGAAGGSLTAGPPADAAPGAPVVGVTIDVPPGAVPDDTAFRLTRLSAQGLPALLPLGASPLAAFELTVSEPSASPLPVTVTDLSAGTVHLVAYDATLRAWTAIEPGKTVAAEPVTFELPGAGLYAVVSLDEGVVAPAPSSVLQAVEMAELPDTSTGTAGATPATVPSSGGRSVVSVDIHSPAALPSGTVVQAEVTETFTIASGEVAREDKRVYDVLLYGRPASGDATLSARVPVRPSREFSPADLSKGTVHVDILTGRESVRGQAGGSDAVVVQNGDARLLVPAGALAENTAVSVTAVAVSSFLPATQDLAPLAEAVVDLSGKKLALASELSLASTDLPPDARLYVARVESIGGIPRLFVVAEAEVVNGRLVSRPHPDLPGVVRGGRYVFYRASGPLGFLRGVASTGSGPAGGVVVTTSSLPLVSVSRADGRYWIPALPGDGIAVQARVPGTALEADATAQVSDGGTTELNLTLTGATTTVRVSPANDAQGVPLSAPIVISASAPLDPATATTDNVKLYKGAVVAPENTVAVRLVLSVNGRNLSVIPEAGLEVETLYLLQVAGLQDELGGVVQVPEVRFKTTDNKPKPIDPNKLVFGFPNESGLIPVTAPAGTFPPGTNLLVINTQNGHVLALTVADDGAVDDTLQGTVDDRLTVTLTDPEGNVTTFERTYYTHPDGTVSVGAAGGVLADGEFEMRIPDGALDSPALIRVTGLPPTAPELQEPPTAPGLRMGSGIKVDMNKPLAFKKEVDLAFPVPDFSEFETLPPESRPTPENVRYWVYRRLDGPDGKVLFETIDVARLEGTEGNRRVVTASYPATGFRFGWNRYHPTQGAFTHFGAGTGGAIESVGTCIAMMMWYHEALLPGRSTPAVVTGTVLRAKWLPGASEAVYEPVVGAAVSGVSEGGRPLIEDPDPAAGRVTVTFTQEGGRFTLFDTGYFTSGEVNLSAIVDGKAYFGRGYLVQENDSKIETDPGLAALVAQGYFSNYLYATITLPPKPPEKPLPKIKILPLRLGADDSLTLSTGVEGENTPLVFGFNTNYQESGLKVIGAEITGPDPRNLPVVADTSGRTPQMDFVATEVFVTDKSGVYTVTAIGEPPEGGSPIRESLAFRIAADGGHNTTVEEEAPKVLGGQTLPVDGARDVPTSVTIRIAFSEPVRGVTDPDAVTLTYLNGQVVPVRLLGFGPGGAVDFDALSPGEAAAAAVSTLTIEPRSALDFATTYRLTIGGSIRDLDQSTKGLDPSTYTTELMTFGPSNLTPLGAGGDFLSAGLAVFGNRAYILENHYRGGIGGAYQSGSIRVFDVSDPVYPQEVPNTQVSVAFPPQDMVGDLRAPLPGEGVEPVTRLVVVTWSRTQFFVQGEIVFHTEIRSTPANLFVYEVTAASEVPQLVGAASLSLNLLDGIPERVAVLGSYAYVATNRKGIQVVDLDATRNIAGIPSWELGRLLSTDGINNDAVVRNIPITDPPYDPTVPGQRYLHLPIVDLKVADFVVDDQSQPIVFATGPRKQIGLVVVNPQTGETLWRGELSRAGGDESLVGGGYALAYGEVAGRRLAVVGGVGFLRGLTTNVVAVVDVANPRDPQVLSFMKLPQVGDGSSGSITDILIKDHFAIVATNESKYGPYSGGTAYLVDLTRPDDPRQIGTVPLVGTRLALRDDNILFSGLHAPLNFGPTPMGGVRAATLNPDCSLVNLRTGRIVFKRLTDVLNDEPGAPRCGQGQVIAFSLCRAARVSLEATRGDGLEGWLDPQGSCNDDQPPPGEIRDAIVQPGAHYIVLPYNENAGDERDRGFRLRAVALSDPGVVEAPEGEIHYRRQNRSILPVGHTFVKGVDTFDGHLVKQGVDLKLNGRHLGIEVTRTYSSAGQASEDDVFGPGWSWNWAMNVSENYECRTVAVQGMDGQVQVFQADESWTSFRPQKGYHGRLSAIGLNVYEYFDKAGVRHHFVDQSNRQSRKCEPRFRLEYIEEPHGDRLVPTYDAQGRVSKVSEVHRGQPVRTMLVTWAEGARAQRIKQIEGLGSKVVYEYDPTYGNLTKVTRTGYGTNPPTAEDVYTYSAGDPRDRHQMMAHVDPNGARIDYRYYKADDEVPGITLFGDRRELVKEVLEYPVKGRFTEADAVKTRFEYDFTKIPEGKRETKVTDTRDNPTTYLLNNYGAPLQVNEPLGRTTEMTWATDDIHKTQEIDPEGRVTDFGYDDDGNLTSERITTDDVGVVETLYRYDSRFNKLEYKKDAEGRETSWTIGDKGDVEQMTDAVGGVTVYGYDDAGQLTSVTDARQQTTTYASHDSFGNARVIKHPEGVQTQRSYDFRGRLLSESDSLGHRVDRQYDAFDRVTNEKVYLRGNVPDGGQLVSSFSTPEYAETVTSYWPAGQARVVMNPYRMQTFYDLDGMNRAVGIRVVPLGYQTVIGYDGNGNKTSETDRRGVTRTYVYDALNRVEREEIGGPHPGGPNGLLAAYGYDTVGNKLTETDHANLTTTFEYDGLYRVKRKILPLAPYDENYTYDKVGNQKSVTDANDKTTSFDYDGLNRLIGTQNPLGQTTTIVYGDKVNKTREVDSARGLQVDYAYDGMNRELAETTTFLRTGQKFLTQTSYVNWDNSERVTDSEGRTVLRRRNGLDKVWEEVVAPNTLNLRTAIAYDVLGNPLMKTDPNGNFTRSRYDGLGRLRFDFDADNKQTSYQVDGEGLRTEEIDRRGVKKTYTYDNLGRLVKTEFNAPYSGKVWKQEIVYDDAGLKRTEIDARGKQTVHRLDRLGRVVRTEYPDGEASRASYDGVNKRTETDQRDKTTKFDYDDINRLTVVTDPLGQTIVTDYLDAQNRRRVKDKKGIYTVIQTDPLDRVVSVAREIRQPAGTIVLEANTYDGSHNKVLTVDGAGNQTKFVYDAANRLIQRIDGFGSVAAATTRFEPDKNGNLVKEIDARVTWTSGFSVSRTYDRHDRVLSEIDGEGNLTQYRYDAEGNLASVTTPKGAITSYTHDELGKTLTVTQPGGLVTTYTYDENRNLLSQEDAEKHVVSMSYDAMNRLESRIQEYGLLTQFKYDPNGNLREVIDPKGQKVEMTHDELNREKTKTFTYLGPETERPWRHTTSISYTNDANDNLERIDESVASGTDPPGASPTTLTTSRTYDDLDRLAAETTELPDSGDRTVSYSYYDNGLRKTVTDPEGVVTTYTYDALNRLKSAASAAGTTSYSYFPDGLIQEVRYPNGVSAVHAYDKADRLVSLVNRKDGTEISSYAYGYDPNGNRQTQVETNGGAAELTSYTYDPVDRLETITYPTDDAFPQGRFVRYEYDRVGNRIRETERAADSGGAVLADRQAVFDNLNRLTAVNDLLASDHATFGWDANGNQTGRTQGGVTTDFRYDARDRMVEVGQGTAILGRYQYDAEGRRSKKIGAEGLRQFVYDDTATLVEYDESGAKVGKYDYGLDRLVSATFSGEGRRFYTFDALGSVTALTGDDGSAAARYHLDAWGNFRRPSQAEASRNRFAFTGYSFDRETGLYDAKTRYYDPKLGRFLSQDSFLGDLDHPPSLHRYTYVHNQPTRYVDPEGTIITNLLGGVFSVALGLGVSYLTGEEYEWKDAAVDFGVGFATSGVGGIVGKFNKLGKLGKFAVRAGAEISIDLGGEVVRNEWKGKEYDVGDLATGAVRNFAIGEGAGLLAKGTGRFGKWASKRLGDSDSAAGKFLARDVRSFLPGRINTPNLPPAAKSLNVEESPLGRGDPSGPGQPFHSASARPAGNSAVPPPPEMRGPPLRPAQAPTVGPPAALRAADAPQPVLGKHSSATDPGSVGQVQTGISRDLYQKLRKKTPSKEMQQMVNQGRQGLYRDPALSGVMDRVLEADHVVAMKTITGMTNFSRLTRDQMLEVLNFRRNFIGLTKSANASKGAKDWFQWTQHKSLGITVNPRFAKKMQRKQLRLEYEIQQLINRLVEGN